MPLAENHALGFGVWLGEILEVDAVQAILSQAFGAVR